MADGEERLSGQTDLHAFERRYAGFFGGQRRETDSGRRQDFLRIRLQTEQGQGPDHKSYRLRPAAVSEK